MTYEDLPQEAKKQAAKTRREVTMAFSSNEEREHWVRMMQTDAFLLESARTRLASWAKSGEGKAEQIIGQVIGALMAYGVEAERAMMAVQFILHGTQGPVNP